VRPEAAPPARPLPERSARARENTISRNQSSERRSIADLLAEARSRLARLTPAEAWAAAQEGAVLVDTRSPDEQREQGALIPGALVHPLSVVLWRLDGLPREARIVLVCRHGYSSSLAAAQLLDLGFVGATDVDGGVQAWLEAGLPVDPL
jgi:rhodanese-related sulfurtransferase